MQCFFAISRDNFPYTQNKTTKTNVLFTRCEAWNTFGRIGRFQQMCYWEAFWSVSNFGLIFEKVKSFSALQAFKGMPRSARNVHVYEVKQSRCFDSMFTFKNHKSRQQCVDWAYINFCSNVALFRNSLKASSKDWTWT